MAPQTPRRPTQQELSAEVSQLIRALIDARTTVHDFARVVANSVHDQEWLMALASGLCDLGKLIEEANAKAASQRKRFDSSVATLTREKQEALEPLAEENRMLRVSLRKVQEESKRQQAEIDFLSMFTPPPKAPEPPKEERGKALASMVRHAQRHALKQVMNEEKGRGVAASDGVEKRQERIARIEEMVKEHDKKAAAELSRIKEAHADELRRVNQRANIERQQHKEAYESREVDIARRLAEKDKKCEAAERQADVHRLREGAARAQAAAASEVLAEAQAELRTLRDELARTKIELHTAQSAALKNAASIGRSKESKTSSSTAAEGGRSRQRSLLGSVVDRAVSEVITAPPSSPVGAG